VTRRIAMMAALVPVLMVASMAIRAVAADDLQDALDRADALNLFLRIDLQPDQAKRMIIPLERVQQLMEQYRSGYQDRLEALKPQLMRARSLMAAGQELPDELRQVIDKFLEERDESRLDLYRAVDQEMQLIAELLYPEQNTLLDWTPPESIRPEECLQERLRMQRIALGRIEEAGRMLERVKYLDAFNFVTGRISIINEYLAAYYDPQSAEFERAAQIAIEHSDQVRLLSEEQWQANAWQISADLVDRLGLMPALDPAQRPGTVSWSSLYRLFTAPETLDVVRDFAQQAG